MLKNVLIKMINPIIDQYMIEMFTKQYSDNPFLGITAIQKIGIKDIIEAELRAETGETLSRPYGSNLKLSPWHQLLLNPKQLFTLPTKDLKIIDTKVIIGKNCKKPLKLSMPLMVTGMSYGGSLSLNMHIALAIGTKMAGTSTNTGESTIIKEMKDNGKYIIGQINRANLMKESDFKYLDAIEIQLGQGAWGGAVESTTYAKDIDERLRKDWNLKKNEDQFFSARMDNINNKVDLIKMVDQLRIKYEVPIGIKIAASNYIEQELEIITSTNCDYIVIDGAEGGTAVAPPTLEDNLGLPTLYALIRTVNYLKKRNIKEQFSLIIAGGLTNPGDFLKALAIGADAIYIGSIALFASIHNQATKSLPALPPTVLALNTGKLKEQLDINLAAAALSNFLNSCNAEMKLALQAMGKKSYQELTIKDLVCLDKDISEYTNIDYALKKEINNN